MSSASNDFGRDHGLVHEAVITGRKAGWGADEWAKLAHDENQMRQIREVLLGNASIVMNVAETPAASLVPLTEAMECSIDCDASPFVPSDWKVEEHQKGGQFKWNKEAQKNALWLSKNQQGGKVVVGKKLRKELAGKPVLNANVLDFLLANPHLIPEEWKGKYIFFWGTIYRSSSGGLCVRYLYWDDGRWRWSDNWLDYGWDDDSPAALRAS